MPATGLTFMQARYYDGALGRFVSADTLVPGASNPQALNRYSYVFNSPLKYTDPSGHCSGNQSNPDNPDADCWGMIREIEGNFKNARVDPRLWKTDELSMLLRALQGHIFVVQIANFPHIINFHREVGRAGKAGETSRDISWQGQRGDGIRVLAYDLDVTIYNYARAASVSGNGEGGNPDENFLATIFHELTHVAIWQNGGADGAIFRSFEAARSGRTLYADCGFLGLGSCNLPIGRAYSSSCRMEGWCRQEEYIAMTVAADAVAPQLIQNTWLGNWINSLKRPALPY